MDLGNLVLPNIQPFHQLPDSEKPHADSVQVPARCVGAVKSRSRYFTSLLLPAPSACAGDWLKERKPDIQSCLILNCPLQRLSHLFRRIKQFKPGSQRRTGRKFKLLFPRCRSRAAAVPLPPILQLHVPASVLEPAVMFGARCFRG